MALRCVSPDSPVKMVVTRKRLHTDDNKNESLDVSSKKFRSPRISDNTLHPSTRFLIMRFVFIGITYNKILVGKRCRVVKFINGLVSNSAGNK